MIERWADWVGEHAFWPIDCATGRTLVAKCVAIAIVPLWLVLISVCLFPLMIVSVIADMWREMAAPTQGR